MTWQTTCTMSNLVILSQHGFLYTAAFLPQAEAHSELAGGKGFLAFECCVYPIIANPTAMLALKHLGWVRSSCLVKSLWMYQLADLKGTCDVWEQQSQAASRHAQHQLQHLQQQVVRLNAELAAVTEDRYELQVGLHQYICAHKVLDCSSCRPM